MQVLCRHKFSNQLGKYLVSSTIIGSYVKIWGFPGVSVAKNLHANAGDMASIPGPGRSEKANPLQYSCLGSLMNRGARWATAHGVAGVRHELATKQHPRW